MRLLLRLLSALLAILLGLIAWQARDPYLIAWRDWLGTTLAVAGMIMAALTAERWQRRRITWRAGLPLVVLWAAVPVLAGIGELRFRADRAAVLAAGPAEIAALGPHFIVGYRDVASVLPLAERGLIGGVFVSARNLAGRPPAALRDELARLQALRHERSLPPLIVATDQEGGIVARLSPPLPPHPALATLVPLAPAARREAARALGREQGAGLAALGITLNLAPVLDLRPDRAPGTLDFHSRIGQRAIDADPAVVAEIAGAYADGLTAGGVAATAKHFPGLGRVAEDTHHFSARIAAPVTVLEQTDWVPFRALLADGRHHLMIGHVTLDGVDPARPAARSRAVVQELVRGRWGFDGLILTDDLTMGPVVHGDFCAAVADGLSAGVDLLLVSYDGELYWRAMACALAAHRAGRLDAAALARSAGRLARR